MSDVTNIKLAGLGGMGVLKSAEILADALFRADYDVKKSEIHGMSQRGGSVCSDVRFGRNLLSPMIPPGEIDWLVLLAEDQQALYDNDLAAGGRILTSGLIDRSLLPHPRSLNVALLGALSVSLGLSSETWDAAIRAALPATVHEANLKAFQLGAHIAEGI